MEVGEEREGGGTRERKGRVAEEGRKEGQRGKEKVAVK